MEQRKGKPKVENDKLTYIASCSFGKDSLATIILAHLLKEPLDMILYSEVMFDKNVSGEIPEHKEFIYNIAIPKLESWGYKVVIVRADSTYKDNFYQKITRSKVEGRNGKIRGFPLAGKCAINRDCKIPPIRKFYKNSGLKNVNQYVGIAADEPKRLKKLCGTNKISLLEKYGITEEEAKSLCKKYGLLSPIYDFTDRGGCFFCMNCSDTEFEHIRKNHWELWYQLLELQAENNTASDKFNRTESLWDIEDRLARKECKE